MTTPGPKSGRIISAAATLAALSLTSVSAALAEPSTPAPTSANVPGAGILQASTQTPQPHTRFGASVWPNPGESTPQAFQRVTAKYGDFGAARVYFPGMPAPWSSITNTYGNTRLVISFKAPPAQVLSGALDDQFLQWFQAAPQHRITRWSYWHEPEDDIQQGTFSAAQYSQAWQHLRDLSLQANNPRLRSTLILMCYTLAPISHRDWRSYYPGDSVIDVMSYDCYNTGHYHDVYTPPSDLLSPEVQLSQELHKPWAIAELGSVIISGDDGSGRAAWLSSVAQYTSSHHARFVTYFDSDVGVDFRLHDAPSSQAWRAVVGGTG